MKLPYCTLYLDDIEQIVEIVKTQLPDVVFKDDDYEYESIDEIKERVGSKLDKFQIVANGSAQEDNLLELSIYERTISLHVNRNHELLWHQVKGYIEERAPWYRHILASGWYLGVMFILITQYQLYIDKMGKFSPPTWMIVTIISCATLAVIDIWITITHRGVMLERRHAVSGFFSRNKDRLIMLIIGGLLTMLGKYLYSWFFG